MGKGDTWIDRGRMDKSRVKEKARGIKTRKRETTILLTITCRTRLKLQLSFFFPKFSADIR